MSAVWRDNSEHNQALAEDLRTKVAAAARGGSDAARERHVARGKLLPRDRVEQPLHLDREMAEASEFGRTGGAMDLVAGVRKIIVVMDHAAKDGTPKFIPDCTLPITGVNVVDMIVTNLAVFERSDHHSAFRLVEMAPGVTIETVEALTSARFER